MKFRFSLGPSALSVIDKTERASLSMRKKVDDTMSTLAELCVKRVKNRIDMQFFAPLKDGYAIRKRNQGLDPRILIATRDYYDGIEVKKVVVGEYGVTADPALARWLEDGDVNRAPRPHWAPTIRELERVADDLMQKVMGDALP